MARVLDRETVVTRDGERHFRTSPACVVTHWAIMGGEPGWACETPLLDVLRGNNGSPRLFRRMNVWQGDDMAGRWVEVEQDGLDSKRRRPYPDAYTKPVLTPDPSTAIADRIEWAVWRSALDFLFADLAGVLEDIELSPTALPMIPWEVEPARLPAVWRVRSPVSWPIGKPAVYAGVAA